MKMTEINPRAVPGGNIPDFQKQETDRLARDYADLSNEVTEILGRARDEVPAEITNEDELAIVNKFVVDMRDLKGRTEPVRVTEKEPHLRRGEAVDQFFKNMQTRLVKAMDIIGARGHAYKQKKLAEERERREAEAREAARIAEAAARKLAEEQRLQREAEEAAARARKQENVEALRDKADQHAAAAAGAREELGAAAAAATDAAVAASVKPADIVRHRTEDGYMSTMKQVGYVEIIDASKLNKELLWPFLREEAILAALKAYAKTTNHRRPMDGAVIEMRDATVYR